MEVDARQYRKIKRLIKRIARKKSIYRFNIIGLFASGFNIRIKRDNCFYCAEFVKYLLDEGEVYNELPDIIKPIDFKNIDNLEVEYSGILRNYGIVNN